MLKLPKNTFLLYQKNISKRIEMNYFHLLKYVYGEQCSWIICHKSNKLGLG